MNQLIDQRLLQLIEPRWRDAFLAFARTNKYTPEFEAYVESSPEARQAINLLVRESCQGFLQTCEEFADRITTENKNATNHLSK